MENIEVELVDGWPVRFIRGGRTWHVAVRPTYWYRRVDWWNTARRAHKESGLLIDVQVWLVQARIGHNPRTPLVTFHLVLGQDRKTWTCELKSSVAA